MKKKILITGSLGYIGGICKKILTSQGYQIFGIDEKSGLSLSKNNQFQQLSLLNQAALNTFFQHHQFDAVLHFAAKIDVAESVQRPLFYYEHNVSGTLNLLRAMKQWNPVPLVFLSSAAVYENHPSPLLETMTTKPANPYGQSKLMAETMINDASWLPSVILRLFNVAGALPQQNLGENHIPETHLIPLVIQAIQQNQHFNIYGNDYASPDGTCLRDFVHVLDVVRAVERSLENLFQHQHNKETYNIGSGTAHSVYQVVMEIARQLDRKPTITWKNRREGDAPSLSANIQKAKQYLDWKPQHSNLDTIISSALAYSARKLLSS